MLQHVAKAGSIQYLKVNSISAYIDCTSVVVLELTYKATLWEMGDISVNWNQELDFLNHIMQCYILLLHITQTIALNSTQCIPIQSLLKQTKFNITRKGFKIKYIAEEKCDQ